jgi:hypothetical protein
MVIPVNPVVYWLLWFVTYAIVIVLGHTRRRKTGLTDEQIIITAGFSLVGVFSLVKVLINVLNHYEEIQSKLDWDGTTAITISCVLGIAIAVKEVRKLL